ncbi:hypothetical protein [Escherichia coli]|uniref:hypothetical protein n=1 Tax=Escherichia coli TaxID=562 RepID=UPI003EBC5E80
MLLFLLRRLTRRGINAACGHPVDINGNLKNKRIRYRSLVDSFTGSATIFKTSRAYKPDEVSSGLRLVTLLIHGKWEELSNNLDTAFEIFIDDKDKN